MSDRVWDGPPEYDPGAEAQRIAEEFADAAEAYDRAGEARDGRTWQPGVPDPGIQR